MRARRPTTSPELAEIPAHLPGDDLAPHRPHRTRRSQTAQPTRTTGAPAGSTRPDTPPARTSRARRHTAYGLHPDRRIDRHRTSRHSGDRATATQRKESTMTPTRTRKSLTVAAGMATAAALALAACSSGGAPASTANAGSGSGAGDNSGYTIAMVTHETPGDTFWDKIKAGASQAAKNERHHAQVLQRPRPGQAGDPDPERGRLEGRRHRHDAGHAGRARRCGQVGQRRRHPGRRLQLRHRPVPGDRRQDVLRLGREPGR